MDRDQSMWLYLRFWGWRMALRYSLGAALRLIREARGISQADFGAPEARHLWNIENGKSGVTVETLEIIVMKLGVDLLTLLSVALGYERGESRATLLKHLTSEMKALEKLGVIHDMPDQFENGVLKPRPLGKRTSPERIDAVLRCKAQGMTQKETSVALGVSTSAVGRIWNSPMPQTPS